MQYYMYAKTKQKKTSTRENLFGGSSVALKDREDVIVVTSPCQLFSFNFILYSISNLTHRQMLKQ